MNNEEITNAEVIEETTNAAEQPTDAPNGNAKDKQEEQRNVLLGTISYTDEADYEAFLSKLDLNQALFVLIASANYCQSKGAFNLDESELVAKAIKTIKKNTKSAAPATAPGQSETNG